MALYFGNGLGMGIFSEGRLLCRYRIGPSEVENALMEHPAVAETAVVSSPDPVRGEVIGNSNWEEDR